MNHCRSGIIFIQNTKHDNIFWVCSFACIFFTDYVAYIYSTLTTTPRTELKLVEEELKEQVPDPLHCMLEKESKEDAIMKYQQRKEKETVICPPTCTGHKRIKLFLLFFSREGGEVDFLKDRNHIR